MRTLLSVYIITVVSALAQLPTTSLSIHADKDGGNYTTTILGPDPTSSSSTYSSITVPIIPIVLNITDNGTTYTTDPRSSDGGCLGTDSTAMNRVTHSALFSNYDFLYNGVHVKPSGSTGVQFGSSTLRGSFWSVLGSNANYLGIVLTADTTTYTTPLTISSNTSTYDTVKYTLSGACGTNTGNTNAPGVVLGFDAFNNGGIDSLVKTYISNNSIPSSVMPMFVMYNSGGTQYGPSTVNVFGWHGGTNGVTYMVFDVEGRDAGNSTNLISSNIEDLVVATHELAETIFDPGANNVTPYWGNIGQVNGCIFVAEVGDPLSHSTPVSLGRFWGYKEQHGQEVALLKWFFDNGSSTNWGIGGGYSTGGTFTTPAANCP